MLEKKFKSKIPLVVIFLFEKIKYALNFFKPYKISSTYQPILIIGSGRSGNTLLRSMLMAGGQIVFPPESYVWPRLFRKSLALSAMKWEDYSKIVLGEFNANKEFYTWDFNLSEPYIKALQIPAKDQNLGGLIHLIYDEYAKKFSGKDNIFWGDKTPINTIYMDKIIKIFPKAKIIHIVRDPRDVSSSYVKARLYQNVNEAAQFWDLSVTKANQLGRKLPKNQFFEISYEELVKNPESSLKNLCNFSGLSYSETMLDFWKSFDKLGDTSSHEHHKNLSNPLSADSIGKWKKHLSKEQEADILKLIAPTNKKYLNVED